MRLHRGSALAGAGVAIGAVIVAVFIASAAFAINWPWQSDLPQVVVTVKGSVVCSNVKSLDGWGASPSSLSITANGSTHRVEYPAELKNGGSIFQRPIYQFYLHKVKIAKDQQKASLAWKLTCRGSDGSPGASKSGSFDVSRKDLSRTICSFSGVLNPCAGPETTRLVECAASFLIPGPAGAAIAAAEALQKYSSEDAIYKDLKGSANPFAGATACFSRTEANVIPIPTTGPAPQPVPTVKPVPQPTLTRVPPSQPTTRNSPPGPAPSPTISNFAATVQGPGQVQVTFNVGWQAGRDPVNCHFYLDGAETFTAQCGTSSSKTFTGVAPGTHQFSARVTDRFGIASPLSPVLTRTVPAPPQPPPAPGPKISLTRGGPATFGYWYSVVLSGFAPGAKITVTCRDSVDPGGFWTQTFTIDGSGRASDATLCYSGDHPDHWVTGGGVESNHVSW